MAISFRRAREALAKVRRHPDRCLIIHYACQSLYDDREGLSPSVSNIVVKNFANDQTVSFAAHLIAEKLHIPKVDISQRFDEIEAKLLEEFYSFVQSHIGDMWIHWNMVNMHFGFEMLAHRYYILSGKNAPAIDIDNRVNLAGMLYGIYGENYVGVPHMQKLMELNGGVRRDFVLGKDEVDLFQQQEFARLHASTVSKVRFFSDILEMMIDKRLKTNSSGLYIKLESATDGLYAKIIGLVASIYAIVDIGAKCIKYLFSK